MLARRKAASRQANATHGNNTRAAKRNPQIFRRERGGDAAMLAAGGGVWPFEDLFGSTFLCARLILDRVTKAIHG
jgi:hypothetical protein